MNIFIDSDVIISSLLSEKGASYLITQDNTLKKYISTLSYKELLVVAEKLHIKRERLDMLIQHHCQLIALTDNAKNLQQTFFSYTTDIHDAHIVAGAAKAHAQFLITYNIKDFKRDKIKEDFKILVMSPAMFLQYRRSTS